MKLTGTDKFREEALKFEKQKKYCLYPKGTYAHKEYWQEQHRRCLEGYKVNDLWIPGSYYFYLNFSPILAKNEKTGRKQQEFARFTDVDLEYFLIIERARKEKKGVILLKPRRTGFSFKNSRLAVHEYNFYRDAKCIIAAHENKLSTYTMNMALEGLNFLDSHTEWKKQRNPDTKEYVKARYKELKDGIEVWKGNNSEIFTLTFKDNPMAAIGKSANLFFWEECGKFPQLLSSYNLSEPCWKDGNDMSGIPILYGTGGDMEKSTREFSEMFYAPEKYNLLAFDNIWEEERKGKQCGWFIPASRMRFGEYQGIPMVDKDGNSNIELATQDILDLREIKKSGSDSKAFEDVLTQYPLTPSEAFLQKTYNRFPTADLLARQARLQTDESITNANYIGELIINEEGKVEWKLNPELKPISNFPLSKEDETEGCVLIFEMPYEDELGQVPYGRYISGCDPYAQDEAGSSDSLGSIFIYDKITKRIVAEYTARPKTMNIYYENARKLLKFYNAVCLYENAIPGFYQYLDSKNESYLLMDQPEYIKDIIQNSNVNRTKGMHMTSGIKEHGEDLINAWLREQYEADSDVLNLHKIRSITLIQELVGYCEDKNFDRVMAFMMVMYAVQETKKHRIEELNKKTTIFDTGFFSRQEVKRKTGRFF